MWFGFMTENLKRSDRFVRAEIGFHAPFFAVVRKQVRSVRPSANRQWCAEYQSDIIRIDQAIALNYCFLFRLPDATCARNALGDWLKTRLNVRLNCVSD